MAEQGSTLRKEPHNPAAPQEALAAVARAQEAAHSVQQAVLNVSLPGDHDRNRAADIAMLGDVNLQMQIELGRTRMYVEDVLRLAPGSVVELDRSAGDPVDILVNDQPIARGEIVIVNEQFCVKVTEVLES